MHLQRNETFRSQVVPDIGTRNSVYPSADRVTDCFDTSFIPCVVLKSGLCRRVQRQGIEPAPACFVIDTARPSTLGRIDFKLIPVYASFAILFLAFAAELYAGIQVVVYLEFKFEDKVAVVPGGCQESIGSVSPGNAYNGTIFNLILSFAVQFLPSFQVLAIEKRFPVLCA